LAPAAPAGEAINFHAVHRHGAQAAPVGRLTFLI
jgi:hypothetical protein